jgi:cytochrome o ubiquinol oxidase subunit 1
MPKNTAAGLVLAGISMVFGFAMIWHIWWLAIGGLAALLITAIAHTFVYDRSYHISADTVAATEAARTLQLAAIERSAQA